MSDVELVAREERCGDRRVRLKQPSLASEGVHVP